MNKVWKMLVAIVAIATVALGAGFTLEQSPQKAEAWTASCIFTPAPSPAPSYNQAFCTTTRIGGAFHAVQINCKYVLFGISHTYNVTGAYVPDNQWSTAFCGNHYKDGPNASRPDWVIHVKALFYPSDQYTGGGNSGSW